MIPDSCTVIGVNAFYNCSGLTSVIISNSASSIGSGAFTGCSRLTNIIIPNSVTYIGIDAFYRCNNLIEYTFIGITCDEVVSNSIKWGLGVSDQGKFMVVAYCSDGVVVINGNDDSSGSSS